MRSLIRVVVAVTVAASAALAAMLLAAMNWKTTAFVVYAAVAIGYFVWRARSNVLEKIWPLIALWAVTTVMMLSALAFH
jgi:hypothetical protein